MMRVVSLLLLLAIVGAAGVGTGLWLFATPAPLSAVPAAAGSVPQGHLYTGITEEPGDFNPFTTSSAVARTYVHGFTHDTLLDTDPVTGALRGALATSWAPAADGASMVVTLRDGVRFSDGTLLTVADVLFTFTVAKCKDVVLGSLREGMDLVTAVEELPGSPARLRIEFDRRHVAAPQVVGENWVVVQQRWYLARIADQAAREGLATPAPGQPGFGALLAKITASPGPGTGPYAFADDGAPRPSWRRGRDLTLARNEHSWQRQALPGCWNLGGIRLLFIADDVARHAALHQRGVDWFSAPGLAAMLARDSALGDDYQRCVYDRPTLGAYVVQWNTRQGPLRDARVRRALAMLFDRERFVQSIFGGTGRAAVAFAKPDQPGYPRELAPIACDPAGARRLLREAGLAAELGNPLRLRLLVPAEAPWFRQMGEFALAAARDAGVELELQVLLSKEVFERRSGGDWDGAMVLLSMPTAMDPFELFHSQGGRNAMGWQHSGADALLAQQRTTMDPAQRAELLAAFHRIVHGEQPMALLVHPLAEVLVARKLQGATPGPRGLWPERFWVPSQLQRPGP